MRKHRIGTMVGLLCLSALPARGDTVYEEFNQFCLDNFGAESDPLYYEVFGNGLQFVESGSWIHESRNSASVAFETNLPARSYVEYGPTAAYGQSTVISDRYYFLHLHYLTGLAPAQIYHYRTVSTDERGNTIYSEDRTVTTQLLAGAIDVPGALSGPPYILNQSNTTYILTQDIDADNRALSVEGASSGVIIDLNGFTITYDKGLPVNDSNTSTGYLYSNTTTAGIGYGETNSGTTLLIRNGTIRQDPDNLLTLPGVIGIGFNPILVRLGRLTLEGLTLEWNGDAVSGVINNSGTTIARHNIITDRGSFIDNRHQGMKAIFSSQIGEDGYHHNLVKRARQQGLRGNTGPIYSNEVYLDSWDTNSFGVSSTVLVDSNRIFGTGYHVVAIPWGNGSIIRDNFIHLQGVAPTDRSGEYGAMSSVNGIRLTQYAGGTHLYENNLYEGNTIIIKAREGCTTARGTQFTSDANVVNLRFRNNTIKTEVQDDLTGVAPCVVAHGGHEPQLPVFYENNRFITNSVFVRFGDSYSCGGNHQFRNNEFHRFGTRPGHFCIQAGYWHWHTHGNRFIDTALSGGADLENNTFSGSGRREYSVGHSLHITARNAGGGGVIPLDSLRVTDTTDIGGFDVETDAGGIARLELIDYSYVAPQGGAPSKLTHSAHVLTIDGYEPVEVTPELFAISNNGDDPVTVWFTPINIPPDTTPPSAVSNLAVASTTQTMVMLTWTAVGDDGMSGTASQYDIRRHSSPITAQNWAQATQIPGAPAPSPSGTPESLVIEGLQPGTTYHFAMKVADEVPNWSQLSNQASGTTQAEEPPPDTTPPSGVGDLNIPGTTQTTALLAWTAVGDDGMSGTASQYDIRRHSSPITAQNWAQATQIPGAPAPSPSGTPESLVVEGLQPGTTYHFAMKVADEVPNWSPLSNQASGTTQAEELPPDTTPPSGVGDLNVPSTTQTTATLTWTAVGDDGMNGTAFLYDIRLHSAPITNQNWAHATELPGAPAPGPSGTEESMVVGGLQPGTVYHFAIKVADEAANWSALSNQASGTTEDEEEDDPPPPIVTPPAAVDDLATGSPTESSLTLTWTAVGSDGMDGTAFLYDIRLHSAPITNQNWAHATELAGAPAPGPSGTEESMVVAGLQPGTAYHFAMKVADEAANWSALSNQASGSTQEEEEDDPPPPVTIPPAAVQDLAAGSPTDRSLTLTWTAVGSDSMAGTASQYDIRRHSAPITSQNWAQATQIPGAPAPAPSGTAESMVVTSLQPGTVYHFAMRVADEVPVWSALSNQAVGTTQSEPEDDPLPVTTPPSVVTDLAVTTAGEEFLVLAWTAPGNDGDSGQASTYDLRYAISPVTEATWHQATPAADLPAPRPAGQVDSCLVEGLEPGTTYHFALKTANDVPSWSGLSNVASGTTLDPPPPPDTTPPSAVTDLEATALDSTRMTLTWTAPGDDGDEGTASLYNLRYARQSLTLDNWDEATEVEGLGAPQPSGSAESFTVEHLEPGTLYYFALKTADEVSNWSGLSNVVSSETDPPPPPRVVPDTFGPMAILDLAVIDSTETSLTLRWTSPADSIPDGSDAGDTVASFALRYMTGSPAAFDWDTAVQAQAPGPQTPGRTVYWTMEGLQSGTTYRISVRSWDAEGNWSEPSNTPAAATLAGAPSPPPLLDSTPPAVVSTLAGFALGPTTLRLTWMAVGDDGNEGQAARYQLRWSGQPITPDTWPLADSLQAPVPAMPGTWEVVDWTGRSPGAVYHIAVRAVDAAGNVSPFAPSVAVTMPLVADAVPPAAPQGLAVQGTAGGALLSWDPSPEADLAGYQVLRRRADRQDPATLAQLITANTFADSTVSPGILYAYSVAARDVSGNLSQRSGEILFLLQGEPEDDEEDPLIIAVDLLVADPVDTAADLCRLRWSTHASDRLLGFRVYRERLAGGSSGEPGGTTAGMGSLVLLNQDELLPGPGPHVYELRPLPEPGSYQFWIEAVGDSSLSAWLGPLAVEIRDWITSLVAALPNPTSGPLRLVYSLETPATVGLRLFDVQGRQVGGLEPWQAAAGRGVLEIDDLRMLSPSGLPAGVFFASLQVGGKVELVRVVLVRGK